MKFSILIPTRNRLDLLKYAVETVRRQNWDDWEIIVSDNDSNEDVRGFVEGLEDRRVRYFRTSTFVPVTENWNRALEHSTGDYVLMLGDDDCLLQGYFRGMVELLERHSSPDFVYADAIQFAYPGVMPGHPRAFMQIGYSEFFGSRKEPFLMAKDEALSLVRTSMGLRLPFMYNMQHSLVSRRTIEKMSDFGKFFQSPYPDYYASNALFLLADRILIVPQPMVVIGITPKSFGYYYFNDRQDEGTAFLNNMDLTNLPEEARRTLLPGNEMFTSWFLAMFALETNFGATHGIKVHRGRYRYLNTLYAYRKCSKRELLELWARLSPTEKLAYGLWLSVLRLLHFKFAIWLWAFLASPYPRFDSRFKEVPFENILQLFEVTPAAYY